MGKKSKTDNRVDSFIWHLRVMHNNVSTRTVYNLLYTKRAYFLVMYNATDLNLSSFLTLVYLAHQKLILKPRNTETFFNQSDCFWTKNPITNTSCDYCQWIFIFYKSKCLSDNLLNKKKKKINDNQLSPFGSIEKVMCQTHWK